MKESEYWQSYTVLTNEVEDTLASYYTEKEINDYASTNAAAFIEMNANPHFWVVTTHALQTTFMITLGRIFDLDPRSHSIHKLLSETVAHPEYFSKTALARRKRAIAGSEPTWLNEYLEEAWEPNVAGLEKLRAALAPSQEKYDMAFKPIRHKLFAHQDIMDRASIQTLIGKGLITDLEKILYDVHDVLSCIAQLANNGEEPRPGLITYDYEHRIRKQARMTLQGLLGNESDATG